MREKNKSKMRKLLLFVAIASFIAATIEGFLFYANENLFFRILLIIENSIKTFAFDSSISLTDAMELVQNKTAILYTAAGYAYGIAVLTAPCCTLAVIYQILEQIMLFIFDFRISKTAKHVVIFGYNDDVAVMLENYTPEHDRETCIHIVSEQNLSSEERYILNKKGYKVHCINVLQASEDEVLYLLQKTKVRVASNIILFEESSIKNFSLLQMFQLNKNETDNKIQLQDGAKITCRCDDDAIESLIADYYDSRDCEDAGYDLEMISIPEIQVHKMYHDVPLHTYYLNTDKKLSEWNVRLMIIGFGTLGQQALLQAMNLGIVHEKNSITIDVFDHDMKNKSEIFATQFSSDSFTFDPYHFRLKEEVADGRLDIHFCNVNVRHREFLDIVRKNCETSPYTYVVIAIDDVNIAINCAMKLGQLFESFAYPNIPIMIRMDSDKRLARYISKNNRSFVNVGLLDNKNDILTLNMILDTAIDITAKKFNHFYNNIQIITNHNGTIQNNSADTDIEKEWNKLLLFKRICSKAAAHHEEVKSVIIDKLAKENHINPDTKIDELVGTNGSLFQYTGSGWQLTGSDEDFIKAIKKDAFAYSLAVLEHRRWCYFMASIGWKNGDRNDRLKQNPCLVTQDKLLETKPEMCKYDLMSLMARYKKNTSD